MWILLSSNGFYDHLWITLSWWLPQPTQVLRWFCSELRLYKKGSYKEMNHYLLKGNTMIACLSLLINEEKRWKMWTKPITNADICLYLELAILKDLQSNLTWYRCPGKGTASNLLYHLSQSDTGVSLTFFTSNYLLTCLAFSFHFFFCFCRLSF